MLPLLPCWAALCELAKPRPGQLPPHPVGLKTGNNRNPEYQRLDQSNFSRQSWYLDTAPLTTQLKKDLDHYNANSDTSTDVIPDPELITRLIDAWGNRARRRFPRTPASSRVEASLGLRQLHHLFKLTDNNRGFHPTTNLPPNAPASAPPSAWTPKIDVWRMKDRSPGGYRLSLQNGQSTHTRVGELIGVRGYPTKSLAAGGWLVGVVRWLRSQPGSDLDAGVEWLAPKAKAVTIKPLESDGNQGASVEGLELPAVRVFDRDASLITPTRLHNPSQRVMVAWDEDQEVKLRAREEDTGEHARFWITRDPTVGA